MILLRLLPISLLAASLLANPVAEKRQTPLWQYIVHNLCPSSINLYIGGQFDSVIASQGNTTKLLPTTAGLFYTDANGGSAYGIGTLRAGFIGEQFYYYMVKDPLSINVGMQIAPDPFPPRPGFCISPICNDVSCDTAFASPPTQFPPSGSAPPSPPLFQCPSDSTTRHITFCPSGSFPVPQASRIHTNFNDNKCLDVRGAVFANGTPVQIYDCNGTPAQDWIFKRGSTKIQLAGTNFCLDAGSTPGNGVGMKIWQCSDDLPAQKWFYSDNNKLFLEGQGQCLDLTNGNLSNSNQVQTWQCTDNDQNQVWTI